MEDIEAIRTIAPRIIEECNNSDVANVRAVLMEVQQKIDLAMDIIERLDNVTTLKNSMLLSQILQVFEEVFFNATKTKKMNRAMYYLMWTETIAIFKHLMDSLRFYVDSLQVFPSSPLAQKLIDLGDAWEDVEEDKSIKSISRRERKDREEIQHMIRTGILDIKHLRRLGLADSKSDVIDLRRRVEGKRSNLSQVQTKNAEIEAQNMLQLIRLLQSVEAGFEDKKKDKKKGKKKDIVPPTSTPNKVKIPTCPVTFEPMIDPIIVDGKDCKCCVSRCAFEYWIQQSRSVSFGISCPICGGDLHSTRTQPNTYLADIISDLTASDPNQRHADSSDTTHYLHRLPPRSSANPTNLRSRREENESRRGDTRNVFEDIISDTHHLQRLPPRSANPTNLRSRREENERGRGDTRNVFEDLI